MLIRGKPCVVFDIEVFTNIFHVTAYNTETKDLVKYEVSERKNNIRDVIRFFSVRDCYFVGYNNLHYDNPIINYCIEFFNNELFSVHEICTSIYNLSRVITDKEDKSIERWKRWKYANNFETLDLLTMLYSQALRVSLKEMQVTMHYKNVQEFVVDWSVALAIDKFDDMIAYNINDVMSTNELLERSAKDIALRISIEDEYHIRCLSKDGVGIGTELLKQRYLAKTGQTWDQIKNLRSPMDFIALRDVILPKISYSTQILQSLLERLKMATVSPGRKGLEEQFIFGGLKISVGVGGIHSKNTPEIITPAKDEVLLDCDAASLYPSLLISYGFYPKHLGHEFVDIYTDVRTERLQAKHSKQKNKDTTLKLLLNSVTG